MPLSASANDLLSQTLSDFFAEIYEPPSGSVSISNQPIRIWVIPSNGKQAIELSVASNGSSIQISYGKPEVLDMGELGRTKIVPQFEDAKLRAQSVVSWKTEPLEEGEKLVLAVSDGSALTIACHGDDELRVSIDRL